MTQEQKELILKDLCGRLPYNTKIQLMYFEKKKFHLDNNIVLR